MGKLVKNKENYKFEINNLNLHYGDFHALKNINMNIEKNQITAFIGPSGCGKSTFLKTLNRMNDLVDGVKIDGNVYLDGKDIFADMDAINLRHRVGMVFQQPNPFPKSIYDNIAYGPRLFGAVFFLRSVQQDGRQLPRGQDARYGAVSHRLSGRGSGGGVCQCRAQGPRGRRDDPQPRAQVVRHGQHDL